MACARIEDLAKAAKRAGHPGRVGHLRAGPPCSAATVTLARFPAGERSVLTLPALWPPRRAAPRGASPSRMRPHLVFAGMTRRRPHAGGIQSLPRRGGVVELHVSESLLTVLAADPPAAVSGPESSPTSSTRTCTAHRPARFHRTVRRRGVAPTHPVARPILRVHGMPVPGPWRRPGPHPRPRPTRRHERRQSGTGLPARPSPQTRRRVAVVPTRTRLFLLGQPLGGICHTQPPPIIEDLPDPQPGLPYPAYVPLATSRDYRSCNVHHLSRTLHLRLHAIRSIPTNRRRSRCAADRAVRAGRPGGDAWSARVSALGAKPTRAAGKNSEVPRVNFRSLLTPMVLAAGPASSSQCKTTHGRGIADGSHNVDARASPRGESTHTRRSS